MSMPSKRAASRTLRPGGMVTGRLSIMIVSGIILATSFDLHRALGTHLPTRIASRAFVQIYRVPHVWCHWNRLDRTPLRAKRATRAVFQNRILNQRRAFARRATPLKMRLVFLPEVAQRGEHRVRRGFPQTTKTAGSYLARKVFQF